MKRSEVILLIEDNDDDVLFLRRALRQARVANPVVVLTDGQMAYDYLSGIGSYADRNAHPLPALILLDLKLPYKSGHMLLPWIREQESLQNIPVIILTSSDEPTDVRRAYQAGATSYLVKPPTAEHLNDLIEVLKWSWVERTMDGVRSR